jgi:hypothetical protein
MKLKQQRKKVTQSIERERAEGTRKREEVDFNKFVWQAAATHRASEDAEKRESHVWPLVV